MSKVLRPIVKAKKEYKCPVCKKTSSVKERIEKCISIHNSCERILNVLKSEEINPYIFIDNELKNFFEEKNISPDLYAEGNPLRAQEVNEAFISAIRKYLKNIGFDDKILINFGSTTDLLSRHYSAYDRQLKDAVLGVRSSYLGKVFKLRQEDSHLARIIEEILDSYKDTFFSISTPNPTDDCILSRNQSDLINLISSNLEYKNFWTYRGSKSSELCIYYNNKEGYIKFEEHLDQSKIICTNGFKAIIDSQG